MANADVVKVASSDVYIIARRETVLYSYIFYQPPARGDPQHQI